VTASRLGAGGMALVAALVAAAQPPSARASFESAPPSGAGPVIARFGVVVPEAGMALFHNPALVAGRDRGFVRSAGGRLFGIPALSEISLAAGVSGKRLGLAAGATALGDSVYGERRLGFAVGWKPAAPIAVGLGFEREEAVFGSGRGVKRDGFRWGVWAARGGWEAGLGGLAVAGERGAGRGGGSELCAAVVRQVGSSLRLGAARSRKRAALREAAVAWFGAFRLCRRLELWGAGEAGGSLGLALLVRLKRMDLWTSMTLHPLLGETPEGGLLVRW